MMEKDAWFKAGPLRNGIPEILRVGSSEASTHLPERHLTVPRGPGVGCRIPTISTPDWSLGPSSAHPLSPTFTPREGADLEGSHKEEKETERARLGG